VDDERRRHCAHVRARRDCADRGEQYGLVQQHSAIITSVLVIVAFVSAYLNVPHEYGVGVLFILALAFFTASLVNLVLETRIALHEMDHYR
jgi:hypothetical protein